MRAIISRVQRGKPASSQDSRALSLAGRRSWKHKVNEEMSKGGAEARYTRPLATDLKEWMEELHKGLIKSTHCSTYNIHIILYSPLAAGTLE